MNRGMKMHQKGFVLPFSVITAAAVLLVVIATYFFVRSRPAAVQPAAAVQPSVDPQLAARLAEAQAALNSQTAILDRMLVESQVQSKYGTIYEDGYVAATEAAGKTNELFAGASPSKSPASAAAKTVQQAIDAKYQQINDTLASWKASLSQYNDSKVSIANLGIAAKEDSDALHADILQLKTLVDSLTPDASGLTQDQIDAYKKIVADASQKITVAADTVAPFADQQPASPGITGGPSGGTPIQNSDGSGGGTPQQNAGGTGPLTQQDLNAQADAVKEAQAKKDAIQAEIDAAAALHTPASDPNGTNNGQNPNTNIAPDQGQGMTDAELEKLNDANNQKESSDGPKLIEGANKY